MMEPSLLALHRIPSDGGAANFSRYREGLNDDLLRFIWEQMNELRWQHGVNPVLKTEMSWGRDFFMTKK
ncbi:hypothetical protein AKG37_02605 [Bacillus australimaris]|uniref:Uncharacterized protein n=1 Tax=Bacillus australimaris TaxID=1326968 RepID=A0ABR5MXZ3_9BACI|nr:hypothetical protein AKG37_02605 [Bacillus australimaris]GLF89842.1 hypothetical protein Saga11_11010 [Bacillus safensis]